MCNVRLRDESVKSFELPFKSIKVVWTWPGLVPTHVTKYIETSLQGDSSSSLELIRSVWGMTLFILS